MKSVRVLAPVALFLSLVSAPLAARAQARCDCAASTCVPARGAGALLRGRIIEAEGRDANDAVEHYLALVVATPACAEFADAEGSALRVSRATTLQLILTDGAVRARLRASVGHEVALRGVAVEQISAHHHTPLLLDDVTLEAAAQPAEGASPRVVSGAHANALAQALRRVRGASLTRAGAVSARAFQCVEQGVGAGYDREANGPPPPPSYTCEGGITARGLAARGVWRALLSAGVAQDCAMGGRCEVAAGDVACGRESRTLRCQIGQSAQR